MASGFSLEAAIETRQLLRALLKHLECVVQGSVNEQGAVWTKMLKHPST
jgi:hypothetical protein